MTVPVLRIDVPARRANLAGYEITLTRKEFDVLTLICQNPHRVISRDEIFREVWGYSDLSEDRPSWNTGVSGTKTLDMHMVTLRKKLGFSASTSPIETVRGIGYRLDPSKVHVEIITREHGDGVSWWVVSDRVVVKSGPSVITLTLDDLTAMINKMYED